MGLQGMPNAPQQQQAQGRFPGQNNLPGNLQQVCSPPYPNPWVSPKLYQDRPASHAVHPSVRVCCGERSCIRSCTVPYQRRLVLGETRPRPKRVSVCKGDPSMLTRAARLGSGWGTAAVA
jgi:hypothetical protein